MSNIFVRISDGLRVKDDARTTLWYNIADGLKTVARFAFSTLWALNLHGNQKTWAKWLGGPIAVILMAFAVGFQSSWGEKTLGLDKKRKKSHPEATTLQRIVGRTTSDKLAHASILGGVLIALNEVYGHAAWARDKLENGQRVMEDGKPVREPTKLAKLITHGWAEPDQANGIFAMGMTALACTLALVSRAKRFGDHRHAAPAAEPVPAGPEGAPPPDATVTAAAP